MSETSGAGPSHIQLSPVRHGRYWRTLLTLRTPVRILLLPVGLPVGLPRRPPAGAPGWGACRPAGVALPGVHLEQRVQEQTLVEVGAFGATLLHLLHLLHLLLLHLLLQRLQLLLLLLQVAPSSPPVQRPAPPRVRG